MASGVIANIAAFALNVVVSLLDPQQKEKTLRSEAQELVVNQLGVQLEEYDCTSTYETSVE